MSEINEQNVENQNQGGPTCNVNMTFNYIVGAVAVSVAVLVGYLGFLFF